MNGLKERPQQAERVRLAVLVTDRWVAHYVRRYVLMFFPISQRRLLARSLVRNSYRSSVRPSVRLPDQTGRKQGHVFRLTPLTDLKKV